MPQASNTIYLSLYKFIQYLYCIVRNFPKEYKYTLGADILNLSWKSLDYVIITNSVSNKEKRKYLEKTIAVFNSLKYRLRLSSDLKLFNNKKYAYILESYLEIEKMLNAWLAWSKRQ